MPLIFVTGPVRSGKSRYAERLAAAAGDPVLYVATARRDPDDAEWEARIAHHRARRPRAWEVVESAAGDAPALATLVADARSGRTLLVDSFGTWLAAGMHAETNARELEAEAHALADAMLASAARVIVVGEEVGWGIVPLAASARLFRDVAGRVQQRLAAGATEAYLVVAGFAIDLARAGERVEGPRDSRHQARDGD